MHTPISKAIINSLKNEPTKIAVVDGDRCCTFTELREISEEIAAGLKEKGIGPGTVVGIALPRSIEWIASMLATIWTGSAFLPLDPTYPPERLSFCADNSGAQIIISDELYHCHPNCCSLSSLRSGRHSFDIPSDLCADNGSLPAYLLYTSGSTGIPKGVIVSRNSLSYQMTWLNTTFELTKHDIFLQKTPVSFDASIWEYLSPLMLGSTVIIGAPDPAAIAKSVRDNKVSVLQLVPTVLQAIVDLGLLADLRSLRLLFCGGEALPARLVKTVQTTLHIPVINLYGPTEATIQSSFYWCHPGDDLKSAIVPIGNPIDGTKYRIEGYPVGELIIEGPGVALGYHAHSQQTKNPFFETSAGTRAYRTGDIVEFSGGTYHYKGRLDNQVKLRGQRVELDDIEENIRVAITDINDACAIVSDSGQLVVFIVDRDHSVDLEAALRVIAKRLPSYMVPDAIYRRSELPSLPNGKRDRKRLAIEQISHSQIAHKPTLDDFVEKYFSSDRQIAQFVASEWIKLLPATADPKANFFLSGGHSLLAMQLVTVVGRRFNISIKATTLFSHPTLLKFINVVARAVRERDETSRPVAAVPMSGTPQSDHIWFIHPAGGAIWCYADIVKAIGDDFHCIGIECSPVTHDGKFDNDLKRMARRYTDFIVRYQPSGPYVICGYSFGGNLAFEICCDLERRGIAVKRLILLDTFISKQTPYIEEDFLLSYASKFNNGIEEPGLKGRLIAMDSTERLDFLLSRGKAGGHLPNDATADDVRTGLSMWVANNIAACTHTIDSTFTGPTLFFKSRLNIKDSTLGWESALADSEVITISADHFSIYKEPSARKVGQALRSNITLPSTIT